MITSLHWVEFRFLVPPPPAEAEPVESRCSAISSEMKVFRSTSWRPLRLPRHTEPEPEEPPPPAPPALLLLPLTCVGEPGAPERTLMLAMAPLRPAEGPEDTTEMRSAENEHLNYRTTSIICPAVGYRGCWSLSQLLQGKGRSVTHSPKRQFKPPIKL